jgi:hypothetical protein
MLERLLSTAVQGCNLTVTAIIAYQVPTPWFQRTLRRVTSGIPRLGQYVTDCPVLSGLTPYCDPSITATACSEVYERVATSRGSSNTPHLKSEW